MITSAKGRRMLESVSPIYEQSVIMQAILEAIGAEWDDVDRLADEVLDQLFPQTATWGIVYWEMLLKIPVNKGLPIEQRRARVLSKMQTRWPVTKARMEQIVNQFVSSKDARIQERYADYSFDIILPFGGFDYSEVTRLIEEVKPAHLAASYEARAKELALVIATRPRSWHFDYPLTNILRTATKPGKSLPSRLNMRSRARDWLFGYSICNKVYPQGTKGAITKSTLQAQAHTRVFLFEYPLCGTFATGEVSA